jgi:restriction endonuclease S subunit
MCEVEIPLPSIEQQEAIVKIFSVLEKRKVVNRQLNEILEIFPPTIMQGVRTKQIKSMR